ncbi:MAG TPA: M24 family metallopeptidase, partial [Polyangiaceae bacterium]|nr:M24 family metallopeptidase [Polyangiaceae bacterium]
MAAEHYGPDELEKFKEVQRLAYDCAEEVARELRAGDSEREAARRLGDVLEGRGVQGFFHQPFAWFGDRSGFYWYADRSAMRAPIAGLPSVAMARQFFPTDRRLEQGMAAILDVAPIVDGYCADIGYAFSLGENKKLSEAKNELAWFRTRILELVRAGAGMRSIYREVDARLAQRGYENCHFF